MTQKVTSIVTSQTNQITRSSSSQVAGSIISSNLALRLSYVPSRPQQRSGCFGTFLLIVIGASSSFAIGFELISTAISEPFEGKSEQLSSLIILTCISIISVLIGFAFRIYYEKPRLEKDLPKYKAEVQKYELAMKRHANLFYCFRCDRIFIPGENVIAEVEHIPEFLYSPPR